MHLHAHRVRSHHSNIAFFVATIFLTLHYVFIVYISSSYLGKLFSDQVVGFLYALGSIATIGAFTAMPKLIQRHGNRVLTLTATIIELSALLGLAAGGKPWWIALLFVAHLVLASLLSYNFDLFLEAKSKNKSTGSTRGLYLTLSNITFVISPIVVGAILDSKDFSTIYFISALLLVPVYAIIYSTLNIKPTHEPTPLLVSAHHFVRSKNLRNVFYANAILQFFYAWMTIYTPLYLSQNLGFSWSAIGVMFSIMLLPFVIFEYPLGWVADKWIGEKEILIGGFVIMTTATLSLAFIPANFFLWTTVLFATRIGASAVEIMTETYFFKKVASSDVGEISFFRMSRPLAYITAPLIAALGIGIIKSSNGSLSYTFAVLALIVILGVIPALKLKDTK
jgi:MFS family permease